MIGSDRDGLTGAAEQDSVRALVVQASEQLSQLVRQEMRLAQAEIVGKAKRAGIGGGLFGGAGLIVFVALQVLAAAAVAALSLVVAVWAAALIVAGGLLAVAGVVALAAKSEMGRALPPVPQEAIANVKADVDMIKERAHHDEDH
jgi:Putative Actinobacterial Holin-X, holin superfamily III